MTADRSSRSEVPPRQTGRRRAWLALGALATTLSSGGCALDDLELAVAGRAKTGGYVVGVTLDHGEGVLYVCGTTDSTRPESAWFTIDAAGSIVDATGTTRGSVTVQEHVAGAISIEGEMVAFDLDARADAGLILDGFDSGCRTGVVTFRGEAGLETAGTWCSSNGLVEQGTPITPVEDASAGLWVRTAVAPGRQLLVRPVKVRLAE